MVATLFSSAVFTMDHRTIPLQGALLCLAGLGWVALKAYETSTFDAAAFVVSDPLADLADEVGSFRGAPRHRLDDLFDESPPPPARSPGSGAIQAGPRDVAVVMFTSGSTGRPKGVPMTHAGLLHACRSKLVAHGGFANVARGTVSFLPNFHVIGFVNNFLFNGYARCPGAVEAICGAISSHASESPKCSREGCKFLAALLKEGDGAEAAAAGLTQGRKRVRNSQLQRLLSRSFSTRFG